MKRGKETDGEILRQKQNVHVCVWSHVPECVFIECQKKKRSGTMDMTPSAERRGAETLKRLEPTSQTKNKKKRNENTTEVASQKKKKLKLAD